MVAAEEEDDEVPGKHIYIANYYNKYIYFLYVLIL